MPDIEILDQQTIDKIAAGEVIERPSSVVKELVENAIDAKASAITVEIKEGGISFIRITDNGCGIEKEQVPLAFLPHSTSKIRSVEDLVTISSLGFRGEALSSIAAIAQVELITKTSFGISGVRYVIEGGKEKSIEEIGAPEGTTFLVRNLFYNTPARKKFLKSPQTEASYIGSLMEHLALSHPEISFKLIVNNQPKLHTSGNSNLKEIIYYIYGREIAANLIEIQGEEKFISVCGFIGTPLISRGNRNFENYFINGRYIKSNLIAKSIEEAYKSFVMQHKYPFTVLHISINGNFLDVNVHPTKMELRFGNEETVHQFISTLIRKAINQKELVYPVSLENEQKEKFLQEKEKREYLLSGKKTPVSFEKKHLENIKKAVQKDSPYEKKYTSAASVHNFEWVAENTDYPAQLKENFPQSKGKETAAQAKLDTENKEIFAQAKLDAGNKETATQAKLDAGNKEIAVQTKLDTENKGTSVQAKLDTENKGTFAQAKLDTGNKETVAQAKSDTELNLEDTSSQQQLQEVPTESTRKLLDVLSQKEHKIIGQLFNTYWLVEFDNHLYIIDQHAAHEKVLYERTLVSLQKKEFTSQMIYPPILLTLNMQEELLLKKYRNYFEKLGYEIEYFGGKEYSVTAVPANLFGLNGKELIIEILDSLVNFQEKETPQKIIEKIASMSCKAAVKGNQQLSRKEIEALIEELLTLENPYHCPHGRPTIISMSKYELEKKFKRVL